jgi:hypothetical protein
MPVVFRGEGREGTVEGSAAQSGGLLNVSSSSGQRHGAAIKDSIEVLRISRNKDLPAPTHQRLAFSRLKRLSERLEKRLSIIDFFQDVGIAFQVGKCRPGHPLHRLNGRFKVPS